MTIFYPGVPNINAVVAAGNTAYVADNVTYLSFKRSANLAVVFSLATSASGNGYCGVYDALGSAQCSFNAASYSYFRRAEGLMVGTNSNDSSAVLNATSTTKGFLPPRMTTAQKNAIGSPAEGLIVYDTDLHKLCVKGAAGWETITSV